MLRWLLCINSGCLPHPKHLPKARSAPTSRPDLEDQLQAALRRAEAAEIRVDAVLAELELVKAQSLERPFTARNTGERVPVTNVREEQQKEEEEEVRNLAMENRALRDHFSVLEGLKAVEQGERAARAKEDCEALRCRLASAQSHAAELGEVARFLELETQASSNAFIAIRRVRQLTAGLRRLQQQLDLSSQPGADDDEVGSESHEGNGACQKIHGHASLQWTSSDGQSSDSRRREELSRSGDVESAGPGPVFYNIAYGDSDVDDESDASKDDFSIWGESCGAIKRANDWDIDWYLGIDDGHCSTQDDGADADNEASPQPRTGAHSGLDAESPTPSIRHKRAVEACLVDEEENCDLADVRDIEWFPVVEELQAGGSDSDLDGSMLPPRMSPRLSCDLADVRDIEWFPVVEELQAGGSDSDLDGSMLPPRMSPRLSKVASVVYDLDDENWPSIACFLDWEVEAAVSRVSIQVMLGHKHS